MHAIEYSEQAAQWLSEVRGLRVCEPVESEYGAPEWQRADRELRRIARGRARLDHDAAVWILRAVQAGTAERLGMSSDVEYVSRVMHCGRREAYERLRVAEALAELPRLADALRDGELGWSAVRELSRILVAETEEVWLDAVVGMTVREIEVMVAGRKKGDLPTDPKSSDAREVVLSFRVSVATAALLRDALQALRREAGSHLSDDDALAQLARTVLMGPRDQGRASYQIAVDVCPSCKKATRTTDGESVPIDESVVAMAACDAEIVDLRPPTEYAPEGTPRRDSAGVTEDTARPTSSRAPQTPRATQTIPPATRRLVLRRDHGRCVVPGCTHATFVDLHHVTPRSEGGTHDPDGLATVCGAHHAALHEGRICIEGRASSGFVVRHADGTSYGDEVTPAHGVMADAFLALRALGFKETESRRALADVRTHVGTDASVEGVVRRALAVLRATS
jgi:5-methylcytosine-specific restriction endonuclease McrA